MRSEKTAWADKGRSKNSKLANHQPTIIRNKLYIFYKCNNLLTSLQHCQIYHNSSLRCRACNNKLFCQGQVPHSFQWLSLSRKETRNGSSKTLSILLPFDFHCFYEKLIFKVVLRLVCSPLPFVANFWNFLSSKMFLAGVPHLFSMTLQSGDL